MSNSSRFQITVVFSTLLLMAFMLTPAITLAATGQCHKNEVTDRPKIGLVLGGGGARGYAHLGVLQKLEELRIPYDYIAGTSMGSIVGGFLATGMTSAELSRVVSDADWGDLFKDKTNRSNLPFRRKEDDSLGLFGPKLGIGKDADLLPKGAISGQKVIFMFESVVSQRVNATNFDLLAVPYRAIATDIVSGQMVVIGTGELSMAMRASMAVPGVFDPVSRGDMLLVDGGLVRNLPVDVARDMGADVVIAVDVGTKLAGKDKMTSALAIIYQMSGLLTVTNTQRQIETLNDTDVLISPDIGDTIASADFNKLEVAIPLGYAAAEAVQEQLQKYSLSETDYDAWRRQIDRCVQGPPQVHFVQLNNQSRFSDQVILNFVTVKPGEPLDLDQLDHDIRKIYGLGFIRQARYSIVERDGLQGIEITVQQDERGTKFIETGLEIAFSARGSSFNLRGAYLDTGLDDRGAEFRALAEIGESPGLFVNYYKPLDDGLKYNFQPGAYLYERPLYVYNTDGDALAEIELRELGGTVIFGRDFDRRARFLGGFTRYKGKMDITVGEPNIEPFSFDGAELFFEFEYDRLDDRYMPTKGLYSMLRYSKSAENLGADAAYEQLEFVLFGSHTFGRHNLMWGGQYNTSLDDNVPIYTLFSGGGFLNMSGFENNSLIGSNYGMAIAGYRYQVVQSGFLPGYVGATLEYGNAAQKRSEIFTDGLLNGSVYFAYRTPLGPVYLGVGWSEEQSPLYFLQLGWVFGPSRLGRR